MIIHTAIPGELHRRRKASGHGIFGNVINGGGMYGKFTGRCGGCGSRSFRAGSIDRSGRRRKKRNHAYEKTASTIEWLEDMGVEFCGLITPYAVNENERAYATAYPTAHCVKPEGWQERMPPNISMNNKLDLWSADRGNAV